MRYSIRQRINPLKRELKPKYYATPAYGEGIDMRMLANEISKNCTLTSAM